MPGYGLDEVEQQAMSLIQPGGVEVAVAQRLRDLPARLALQLQEPAMGAESITAAVQRRDIRSDYHVLGPRQRSVAGVEPPSAVDRGQELPPAAHRADAVRHDPGRPARLGSAAQRG